MKNINNIILCGFMGAGKSSVGKAISERSGLKFIDMDNYIENREGMNIPAIFEAFGEEYFREREHDAILELADAKGLVIASGGGALLRRENAEAFQKSGKIIFLNASFEICYNRIADSDRPLVKNNSREQLEKLYNDRAAIYRSVSDIEIESTGPPNEIAESLVLRLSL